MTENKDKEIIGESKTVSVEQMIEKLPSKINGCKLQRLQGTNLFRYIKRGKEVLRGSPAALLEWINTDRSLD